MWFGEITIRQPHLRLRGISSPPVNLSGKKQEAVKKKREQKGRVIETDLRTKESEGWRTSHILRILMS
jgi:hypothetical protein